MSKLIAEFLSDDGRPCYTQGEKYRHYKIRLTLQDPPPEALTIIYQLDSTYENPIRMVTKGVPDFQEYITAYGDYDVRIAFRTLDEPNQVLTLASERLSGALRARYGIGAPVEIENAILEIEKH